jgi:hypothetical protein
MSPYPGGKTYITLKTWYVAFLNLHLRYSLGGLPIGGGGTGFLVSLIETSIFNALPIMVSPKIIWTLLRISGSILSTLVHGAVFGIKQLRMS